MHLFTVREGSLRGLTLPVNQSQAYNSFYLLVYILEMHFEDSLCVHYSRCKSESFLKEQAVALLVDFQYSKSLNPDYGSEVDNV